MSALAHLGLGRIADLVLPRHCLACDASLVGAAAPLGLCRACQGRLRPLDPRRRCRGCLRPLPPALSGRPRCLACATVGAPFDELVAVWSYREPLRTVLHGVKFRRLDFLAENLAHEAVARGALASLPPLDAVVAVPLPLARRLARGFNQAERIAAPIAGRLDRPLVEALRRRAWDSRRQSALGRSARRRNPAGGLQLRPAAAALEGRTVLLVDDIVTTGATLAAAAERLREAGAARVVAFALAATPLAAFGEAPDPA
jgi:ComF family protein